MTAVAIHTSYPTVDYLVLWCPGCEEDHMIVPRRTGPGVTWDWNGDVKKPTISPSILSSGPPQTQCHSFVRDGVWEFLSDCDHQYAGQHVPMVRGPHWPKEADDA